MVVASNLDGISNAIGPTPSDTSLRGLDAVNLLLAGALSGFGPYVAVFLAEQNWTQQNIGFVLTLSLIHIWLEPPCRLKSRVRPCSRPT